MKKDSQAREAELKRLCEALCLLETPEEVWSFLQDICSPSEICDLMQRLEVARLLNDGAPYLEVTQATGASSTTVSRVSKCLIGEVGGYRLVFERLHSTACTLEGEG